MCNEEFKFFKGEKTIITATMFPFRSCETVVVTSAEFELISKFDRNTIQSGTCEYEKNEAHVLLDFTDVPEGNYELRVTMEAGVERKKAAQDIEVIG